MEALGVLGGETWFRLGDRDLALHVQRTEWLRGGKTLSDFARSAAQKFGIRARILPMSDQAVRTVVVTDEGELPFQHYFVARHCEPVVRSVRFESASQALPTPGRAIAFSTMASVILRGVPGRESSASPLIPRCLYLSRHFPTVEPVIPNCPAIS